MSMPKRLLGKSRTWPLLATTSKSGPRYLLMVLALAGDSTITRFFFFRATPSSPEVRGQKSEVNGQRSEIRGQKSEVNGQRSEIRGQWSEVRNQKSEVNGQRSEVKQPN